MSNELCARCAHTLKQHEDLGWVCDCSACPWKTRKASDYAPSPPQGPVQRIEHGNGAVSYIWPAEYIGDIRNVLERSRTDLLFVPAGTVDDWGYPIQLAQEKEPST